MSNRFLLIILSLLLVPNAYALRPNGDLISYWSLEEASGNANDARGSNTLTDNGGVGTTTGKVGNARTFANASSQYLNIADNASLSISDLSNVTIAGWFKFTSKAAGYGLMGKCSGSGTSEYWIDYDNGADRLRFAVGNGAAAYVAVANTFGSPSTGTWYFIVGWYDPATATVNIQVNDGAVDSVAAPTGAFDGTGGFALGKKGDFGPSFDGVVDEAAVWRRYLTAAERTDLYNSGNGRSYFYINSATRGKIIHQ